MKKVLLSVVFSFLMTGAAFAQGTSAAPSSTTTASAAAPAAKSDTAKKPAVFRPSKEQIKEVQTLLKGKKLYSAEPSGKYDDETRAGIRSFQKDNGLKDTGTLNRATLEKFGVALSDKQKEIPASASSYVSAEGDKTPKPSSSSKASAPDEKSADTAKKPAVFRASVDQIKAAQKMLKDKSMYSGDESGKLDDTTRDALKKYQDASGLKVTGTLNALTLEKMGIELTDKQKGSSAPAKN
jgi:peptidoglycan hydrolase-like protein with peptidoglycan-binding domain